MTTPPASITVRINGTDHQIDPDQARALRDELCRMLGEDGRLAYNLKETAAKIGLSYTTVFRLVQSGRLRAIDGIRHKIIPVTEIDRFLREGL